MLRTGDGETVVFEGYPARLIICGIGVFGFIRPRTSNPDAMPSQQAPALAAQIIVFPVQQVGFVLKAQEGDTRPEGG